MSSARFERRVPVVLLAFAAWLIVVVAGAAASAQEADVIGRVVRQSGIATVVRVGTLQALHGGAPIYEGDRIGTGAGIKVEIEFADGSTLSVGPETEVEITDYARTGREHGVLMMLLGIVRTRLTDLWADGFEVRTRAAVAAVRATDWVTEAREDRSAVFVVAGTVAVTGVAGGAVVVLGEGEGTDVAAGAAPTPAKRWGAARAEDALARTRLP
jgi:hypothetical protein